MKSQPRIIAALNLKGSVVEKLKRAEYIVSKMTNNPHFPAPMPPLATVTAAITALSLAQTAKASHAKGTTEVRDQKLDAMVIVLQHLRDHVQSVADSDVANAVQIIDSAGMDAKKHSSPKKREWKVEGGEVAGSVILTCPTVDGTVTYLWSYSADGKIWSEPQLSHESTITITGLTPGVEYAFRYRVFAKKVLSNPSPELKLIVR